MAQANAVHPGVNRGPWGPGSPHPLKAQYTVCMYSARNLAPLATALAAPAALTESALSDGAPVALSLVGEVQAGFPSPAEDFAARRIDLTEQLVTHPQATFMLRARGVSMVDAGIGDGDMLVVDRAIKPRHGHVVVAVVDGEFTVKTLFDRAGRVKLRAANVTYPDIVPSDGQTIEIWGVVTWCLKRLPA